MPEEAPTSVLPDSAELEIRGRLVDLEAQVDALGIMVMATIACFLLIIGARALDAKRAAA